MATVSTPNPDACHCPLGRRTRQDRSPHAHGEPRQQPNI